MPIVTGKAKIKVPEGAEPGQEIELNEVSVDVAQDVYERPLAERFTRMARQTQKLQETEAELATVKAEIATLKTTEGGKGKGNEGPSPEMLELQKKVETMTAQLAATTQREAIDAAFAKAKVADIPAQFKNAVKVRSGATPEEIDLAVTEQVEAYNALKKSLGVKEGAAATEEEKNVGAAGNGGTRDTTSDEDKAAVAKVMKSGKQAYIDMLKKAPAGKQAEIAKAWIDSGVFNPQAKK